MTEQRGVFGVAGFGAFASSCFPFQPFLAAALCSCLWWEYWVRCYLISERLLTLFVRQAAVKKHNSHLFNWCTSLSDNQMKTSFYHNICWTDWYAGWVCWMPHKLSPFRNLQSTLSADFKNNVAAQCLLSLQDICNLKLHWRYTLSFTQQTAVLHIFFQNAINLCALYSFVKDNKLEIKHHCIPVKRIITHFMKKKAFVGFAELISLSFCFFV